MLSLPRALPAFLSLTRSIITATLHACPAAPLSLPFNIFYAHHHRRYLNTPRTTLPTFRHATPTPTIPPTCTSTLLSTAGNSFCYYFMGFELDQLELPLTPQLPPVRTSTASAATSDDGCATPTSAANVLRAPSVPPPAPRKPRPPARDKRRKHCHCYRVPSQAARYYWVVAVPHDLAGMFVPRRPSASPSASTGGSICRPPAGKKIRVHVLG